MGLLNYTTAAMLSGAGSAGQVALLQQQRDQAESDKAQLIQQMQGKQQMDLAAKQNEYQVARDQAAPALAAQTAGLTADATAASTVKNADALRVAKTADAKAAAQAQIDVQTDPTNIDKQNAAAAAKAKAEQSSKVSLAADLVKTPGALDNIKRVTLAEHPEQAAQIAVAAAQKATLDFNLARDKKLDAAKNELAAAKTPEEIAAKKAVVQGLEYSVATDRAEQAANASMLTALHGQMQVSQTLLTNPMSSDDDKARASQELKNLQAAADAVTKRYMDNQGLKPAAPAGKTGWDSTTGDVYKDGAKIGNVKSGDEARALISKPPVGAPAAPRSGLINSTPGSFDAGVNGPGY